MPVAKKAAPKPAAKKKAPAAKKAADTEKVEGKREKAAREKAEAIEKARKAKIESGDLIVAKNGNEYERSSKITKAHERAKAILKALNAAKEPVLLNTLAEDLGAYYEEILPAVAMLEAQDLVVRYEALIGGKGRRQVAYLPKK